MQTLMPFVARNMPCAQGGWRAAVLGLVVALAGCGGGDGEVDAVSPSAQCGSLGLTPKVTNGTDCTPEAGSSALRLQIFEADGSAATCTGTLLTATRVLTAAHCLRGGVSRVVVARFDADGNASPVVARSWVVHPRFRDTAEGFFNDAAVVELSAALANPTMPLLVSDPSASGQDVFFAGFGAPGFELAVGNARLSRVTADHVGFVYGGSESNTCPGDSGGPMYRLVNGQPALVGITSFGLSEPGRGVCQEGEDSRFTNIQTPEVLNFIRAQVPDLQAI